MTKKFYVTTPIYYANGSPHIGHFLTTTAADAVARYYRQILGAKNVFFTTGLDEHGTAVEQAALKEGYHLETFQKYVDQKAKEWRASFDLTNISYNYFVRTTHPEHEKFSQDFIRKLIKNGDVYKGKYQGKYCNGCEKFLTLSDLNEKGYCPLHRPDQTVAVEEENYFFKLSKYASKVKKLIEENKIKVVPENKRSEVLSRLRNKIEDVSVSRPKEKVSWGVEFPDDPKHTAYVWIEALLNYTSSLKINDKEEFWADSYHFLGKDISWFHNVIWPAMLLSTKHPLFRGTFVHGFLQVGGEKISKSKGNVITPKDLVEKFGVDGARYLILSSFPYSNDSDVTWDQLIAKYNADLANGLGNLVARIAKLCQNSGLTFPKTETKLIVNVERELRQYRFDVALKEIWQIISNADQFINQEKPWELNGKKLQDVLNHLVSRLRTIAFNLQPFLPQTAEAILQQFAGPKIKSTKPLFPRI